MTENHVPVHVLLCDQAVDGRSVDWLSDNFEGVDVQAIPDLCGNLQEIGPAVERCDSQRLVLGVCSTGVSSSEAQTRARRAGIQPAGLQLVALGKRSEEPATQGGPSLAFRASLAGAIARARAAGNPRPENMRVKLSGFEQPISRRSLFTLPPVVYETVPTIDKSRCAAPDGCDLCVRSCPHDALENDAGSVRLSSSRCQTCGVCVAVCPQRAVELPGMGASEVEAHVQESLRHLPGGQASILFQCARTKGAASGDWVSVPVPCVGMVNVSIILGTLAAGADEVALLGCGDDCQSGQSASARSRVEFCNQLLAGTSGAGPQPRVRIIGPGDLPATTNVTSPETAQSGQAIIGYGSGAASRTILAVNVTGRSALVEHPASPLGIVEIDSTTCTACESCVTVCPTGALSSSRCDDGISITFEHADCVACGRCVEVCPEASSGAITLKVETDLVALGAGRRTLIESIETLCERCGHPVASRRMLDRIAAILGAEYDTQNMEKLCVQCRGM